MLLRTNSNLPEGLTQLKPEFLVERIRGLRKASNLTQAQLARLSGISHSSISKIETGQFSPTFETLLRIAEGLKIDISTMLASTNPTGVRTRRAVTRHGNAERHEATNYTYDVLCSDLKNKKMIPMVAHLKAHTIHQFGPLLSHPGEEVLYVLKGQVELHTEHYAPVKLRVGDCAYFDSTMGHACLSVTKDQAIVFWVSTPN